MKMLSTAPRSDFSVYIARPDTLWCEREKIDSAAALYAQGFLPYSGATGLQDIFYSARSARVVLPEFRPSAENRRIARKFDGMFSKVRIPIRDFKPDELFWELCLTYFREKHGPQAMPRERLQTILDSSLLSSVLVYRRDDTIVAYVLEARDGDMGHYWYSFYALDLARQSLGMWLMLDSIRDAKDAGLSRYYLGTVYGAKALYKTNFEPLEWWDGSGWQSGVAALKAEARRD